MLLEKIKTPGLSHLSYLIGSGGKGIGSSTALFGESGG